MTDLNAFNYLNLVGFIINTLITFGASPVFGFPDNGELSFKYQTIVSPAGITFAIWGIIFISQGIFSVMQMLPAYRSHPLIQEGVSYWYFSACIFQSIWTFAFGYEVIALSVLMMGGILCSLVPIVIQQSKIDSHPSSYTNFLFPFIVVGLQLPLPSMSIFTFPHKDMELQYWSSGHILQSYTRFYAPFSTFLLLISPFLLY